MPSEIPVNFRSLSAGHPWCLSIRCSSLRGVTENGASSHFAALRKDIGQSEWIELSLILLLAIDLQTADRQP